MSGKRSIFAGAFAAAALTAISAGPALAAWPYDSIVSFGDSLSDVGNVYAATNGAQPASPYFNGRYSNGPNWADDLAKALHLPLAPSSSPGGTDFAWGGATTGSPDSTNKDGVPTFETQVGQYLGATGGHASPNALYTFSIGANDLFSIIAGVATVAATPGVTPEQVQEAVAAAAGYAAEAAQVVVVEAGALRAAGATDLVLFDVPDLSKTPAMQGVGADFAAFVQGLSYGFDQAVSTGLDGVTGLKVFDLDTFALIDSVVANPLAYGFTDVTHACYVGPYTGGGTECASPDSHLFWDSVHPSAAAGKIIAGDALAAVAPEPSSWAMMGLGFAALGFIGLRSRRAAT
jgi:phospholipase/lecithinase/hemolysin